jgi:hypothetical protein
MKNMSWKYAAAACVAGLLLFTLPANASLSIVKPTFGKQLLKFDNISSSSAVPNGYGSVSWYNFYTLNGLDYSGNPSGYEAGVVSSSNVLYNGDGSFAEIFSDGYAFILDSAYLTGAWNDNLHVQVTGYYNGKQVYSRTYVLSATKPTLISFPNKLVTVVDFDSYGGTPHSGYSSGGEQFATDNVTITVLPIPVKLEL